MVGGAAAASIGAAIGTAILPGIGTFIGGVVGGLFGSVAAATVVDDALASREIDVPFPPEGLEVPSQRDIFLNSL